MKKIIASCLICAFLVNQSLLSVLAADIIVGGPLPTDTNIQTNGNITDIFTNTTVNNGQIGINSFDRFNVNQGDIVNLQLINNQNKLVNLIFDSSASQINGVVNSYLNGQIGGNVLFANPNGFVIGESGVFNVGSLTMMTPTMDEMNKLFKSGIISANSWDEAKINSLISFTFDDNDYFIAGTKDNTYILQPSKIVVNGKINSGAGIDLLSGLGVDINPGAELNANMDFKINEGKIVASKKELVSSNTKNDSVYKTAMHSGNGIVIIAQNKGTEHKDYLSSIVNLNGKIDANGGDVITQTEIYKADKAEDISVSQIYVKENARISGNDVALRAKSNVLKTDENLLGFEGETSWLDWLYAEELNYIADKFVHLADVKTQVIVEKGAVINAINNAIFEAKAYLPITVNSDMVTLAFNYLDVDFTTETLVKSGSTINANALKVNALTDIRFNSSVKASNLLEIGLDRLGKNIFGHAGSYALSFSVQDVVNRAVIEHGAKLNITNDIDVIASVLNNRTETVKNGLIPLIDTNEGNVGAALTLFNSNVENEARMDADAKINGGLNVVADYLGTLNSSVSGTSASKGDQETATTRLVNSVLGKITQIGKMFSDNVVESVTKAFENIHIAAAIGVNIDKVSSTASIGSYVKPVIEAKSVNVGSTLIDNKSSLSASSAASNGVDSLAGSVAVNIKNYTSKATVYGDLILSGSETNALNVISKTDIQHPEAYKQWIPEFLNSFKSHDISKTNKEIFENVDSNNASDFIANLGEAEALQDLIDKSGNKASIFNILNANTLGAHGFFNTFASSQANAAGESGDTNAFAGAVATAIFDTISHAELLSGSTVTLNGADANKNNIIVQAETVNEMWSAATIISLTNFKDLLSSSTARDGNSVGGGISFQYADVDTIANIGQNVKIQKGPSGAEGDLSVIAKENGNYINLAIGSGNADKSGYAGGVAVTVLNGGETKSGVKASDENNSIHAKNLNVKASKADTFVNSVIAYAVSEKSKGFGISGVVLKDSVEAYIAGKIKLTGNALLEALYDKTFVNSVLNVGIATEKNNNNNNNNNNNDNDNNDDDNDNSSQGSNQEPNESYLYQLAIEDLQAEQVVGHERLADAMMRLLPDDVSSVADDIVQPEQMQNAMQDLNVSGLNQNIANAVNHNNTSATAGSITSNVAMNSVKAYVADGAKIDSDGSLNINAISNDNMINAAAVVAANGKTGRGASIIAELTKNTVEAYIGNAIVDVGSNIVINAKENHSLIAGSAGIAQANDSTGAGNVSIDIQKNLVTAAIKQGAKVNTNKYKENQNVSVIAEMVSKIIKGIGALALQSGGNAGASGGAIGATIDGDIAINTINAYIESAVVNAANNIKVSADSKTNLISADVAGAVSGQKGSYDGTIAAYVSANEENAYIKDSQIKEKNVEVKAENSFDEVVIVGTASGGKATSVGASVRTDVVSDKINSYILNSMVNTSENLSLVNNSNLSSIAVAVAGALSTNANAGSGTAMVLADITEQNNYIDNSTINSGNILLDSNKILDTLAVVGGVTAATNGTSVGLSTNMLNTSHTINTYIKNSNITSNNDISLTSDYTQDILNIVFGGAGGSGIAGSGAINIIANKSNIDTFVLSEETSDKKQISADGKLTVKSESNINTTIIDGNTSISTNNVSAGGAINVYTNKANLKSGVDGVNVDAKNGIDVLSKSQQKQKSVVVGAAGGNSTSVQGSVNNIVVEQKLNSYVKNTKVRSGGNISVQTEDKSDFDAVIGAIAISLGSNAVGASISTAVFGGNNQALVENSVIDNYDENNSLKDLIIKSTQNDDFNNGIIAGSVAGSVGVGGAVSTIIFNKEVLGYANNIQNINDSKFQNITIDSNAKTDLDIIAGGIAGGGTAGVGATVNTITFDKKVESLIKNNSKIVTVNKDTVYANAIDNISISSVAGSGGGSYSASGIISTTLVDSAVNSGVEQSTIIAKEIDVRSDAKNNYSDISGAVTGSGVLGVGATVVTNVISYEIQAFLANAIVSGFDKISVNANSDTTFNTYSVSGAGSGSIAGAGVVETNVINNEVIAYALGDIKGNNTSTLTVKAKDTANFNGLAGSLAGGLTAGVGATVSINNVTSTILAYIGSGANQQINVGDIIVNATGVQNFNDLLSTGFAAGQGSATATVLVNDIDTLVKAYVCDNSNIKSDSLSINAEGITTITEDIIGGAGGLYVAVGSSVGVNSIKNIVEAYTGNNVKLNTKTANIKANTTANLGKEDDKLVVVAAAGAAGAAVGAGLKNVIENEVYSYIGNNNAIISTGNIDLLAQADTNIYESVGGGAAGIAGIGASVGVNKIYNTVNSFIGNGSTINTTDGDLSVRALSNEIVDTLAVVVGGAGVALNGGFVNTTIGKNTDNTPEYVLSEEDAKVYDTALKQLDESLSISRKEKEKANENYKNNSGLNSENTLDLFAKSKNAESSIKTSALLDTTSAFVDSDTNLNTRNLTILAQNANDLNINVNGVSIGGAAVGVASGVSNVYTTTNAFVKNNVSVNTTEQIDIKASSIDNQNILVNSATGGVVAGAGGVASINSNKKTNANILASTILNATNDLNIQAVSMGNVTSKVDGLGASGLTVGVMDAEALIQGQTKIYLGDAVSLNSSEGNVLLQTDSQEFAQSKANALAGSLIGGTGAESTALTGKDTTVNIGKNLNIFAKLATKIASNGKNSSKAESDGRAYGVISAGGTKTDARIKNIAGVKIADADTSSSTKKILGKTVEIFSLVENNADAKTNAGAGAIVGVGGSGVYTDINSENSILVGKNYEIETSGGAYSVEANTNNTYKAFNDSSAYGVVGVTVGIIENNISSTVNVESNADIITNGAISIIANNEVKKAIVSNYDLYGGSGGVVGVGSANLVDNIVMNTISTLGGNKAHATGNYDNGYVTIGAQSILNVNQKVHVSAGGAVPVVDGNVEINSRVNTQVNIKNKDIKSYDDDIYFLSNNDIDIYAKSDVHSYGGVAGAGGDSIARNNSAIASVIVSSGVNTVSGRDTYIQAITDKSVLAFIYATTHGLIGTVGGSSATAYNNSEAIINIETDAYLKSLDSMNLIVNDNLKNLKAIREAKGTSRILLGIPIVVYGEGKQYETNNANALITLNGTIESGSGANRSLVINSDGTYTSNGINVEGVIGKEKVGEITDSELSADIEALEKTKEYKIAEINDYIDIEMSIYENAKDARDKSIAQKKLLDEENQKYSNAISNANQIIINNDLIAENQQNADYVRQLEAENLNLILAIKEIDSEIDSSDSLGLGLFIVTISDEIEQNKQDIAICESTITSLNYDIANTELKIKEANLRKTEIIAFYDEQIADLNDIAIASDKNVYSWVIDDIVINSGSMNITGDVVGNGTIKTAGEGFSINIVNNSINDVVYKDIIIGKNIAGSINAGSIASTIKQIIGDANQGCNISITNTVDANDPNFDLNAQNGYGDMVFRGNIENLNGNIEIINNTGSVLTDGFITAKNLKIFVPNGSYSQAYSKEYNSVSGTNNIDSIIASGDINISSKIIDINGLIQSGSEIKSVTIPDFKVIKEGDKYYQVSGNSKEEMVKNATDEYYCISLIGNGQGDSDLETIKAYFKISNESDTNNVIGDIYLSKTNIQGGNITLTGNIISTTNNGKIVLVNGYGHIDINNNSNFNLVTSALSANEKINGKLTLNDFKFSDTDKGGEAFDNLTQDEVENQNWLSQNAGIYTASVDENGNVITTSSSITNGNGNWGATNSSIREDGAKINSVIYTPGSDAYHVTQSGTSETVTYQEYVKRSWWTELWYGKLYRTVSKTIYTDPVYEVAQNDITVQFQGFDKPQINVTTNGSIIMNGNIGATNGNVVLNSSNGSITTNSINNLISAENVNLFAKEDVGSELKPIQVVVNNSGELNVNSNDVYINYPHTDISNIIIKATGNAYLSTLDTLMGDIESKIDITAKSLELVADKGSILWDMTDDEININVEKLKARANGDISIINQGDLNISNISSKSKVSLESKNGSIIAVNTDSINPYNIDAETVVLKALKGYIGTDSNSVKLARDTLLNASANGNVNLSSAGRIYTDLIESYNGAVSLDADYGIIETEIHNNLVYNIYAKNGVNLNTKHGNIENIVINTDGIINASAGYNNDVASGMSDISIYLLSKQELSQEDIESLTNDAEKQAVLNEYQKDLKDMKLGTIKASRNIYIHSEKSILNGANNSSLSGSQVVLSASNGNIGQSDSAIKIDTIRDITAFAGKNSDVYLTSDNNLNINEIRAVNEYDNEKQEIKTENVLNNVVLSAKGNIISPLTESKANIIAKNIELNAGKDVGSVNRFFSIDTISTNPDGGLKVCASNGYVNGESRDLNIVGAEINNILMIGNLKDVNINGVVKAKDVIVMSNNTNVGESIINATLSNISDKFTLNNAEINGDLNILAPNVDITEISLSGNINAEVDDLSISSAKNLNIGNIIGKTKDYASKVNIKAEQSIYNGLMDDGVNIYVKDLEIKAGDSIGAENKPLNIKLVEDNTVSLEAGELISVNTSGAPTNYTDITTKDLYLYTNEDVIIDMLRGRNVKIKTISNNMSIGDMYIENCADLITKNKKVVVSNFSLMPVIDADVQLYVTQHPARVKIDATNNISTPAKNVVRFNDNIFINKKNVNVGMEKTINVASVAAEKNTNVSGKTINKVDNLLYELPTRKTYYENVKKVIGEGIIKNQVDEHINESNVLEIINNKKMNSKIKYLPKLSYNNIKYKKVSSL